MERARKKRWVMKDADETRSQTLAKALGIPPLMGRLLVQRNKVTVEEARRFLYPDKQAFPDPFLLKDMAKAVERIWQARDRREQVMIYGDYDADGATSTCLLYRVLHHLGIRADYYIPDRFSEGYGLNEGAIRRAKEAGYSLIITVDNGISAVAEIQLAKELGLDLIVTDHHTPPERLPEAYAILNPKQPGCPYPDKMLAGVGVVLKLAHALLSRLPEEWLQLAALGTIADLVPLDGENRLIATFGLEQMRQQPLPGIRALLEQAGLLGKTLTAGHVGYFLAPRINAAGRLDSATKAVELLLAEDVEQARPLAQFLEERNKERREIGEQIYADAVAQWEARCEGEQDRVQVLASPAWNAGVIGIVASRLVETYYRPVFLITIDGQTGKGSARSIPGFDVVQALHSCDDLLDHYGGHTMAGGFSLPAANIPLLRRRLNQLAEEWLQEEDLIPPLLVDAEISLSELDLRFAEQLSALGPFGFGNPSPHFVLRGMDLKASRPVGKEKEHLQLLLGQGNKRIAGVAFRRGNEAEEIQNHLQLDVVGEVRIDEWNGERRLQLMIDDWQGSRIQLYDLRHRKDKISFLRRKHLAKPLLLACFADWAYRDMQKSGIREQSLTDVQIARVDETGQIDGSDSGSPEHVAICDFPYSLQQFRTFLQNMSGRVHLYMLPGEEELQRAQSELRFWLPDRESFACVYRLLQKGERMTLNDLWLGLKQTSERPLSQDHLSWILQVFVELGFAHRRGNTYDVIKGAKKRSLLEARTYQERMIRVKQRKRLIEWFQQATTEQLMAWVMGLCYRNGEEDVS